jgi:uncharacterized Zn-binding protein involved in type VI secretion
MSASLPAARMGDPIAHGGAVVDSCSEALVCVALSAVLAPAGCGGAASVTLGAAVACGGGGGGGMSSVAISVGALIPGAITGAIVMGSPNTFIGGAGLGAALAAAAPLPCAYHALIPIMTGSASVFVNDHLLARESDLTACGALIASGAQTVLVGGAASGGPPPSPMAACSGSGAMMGTAVGAALAMGASVVTRMSGLSNALVVTEVDVKVSVDVEVQTSTSEAAVSVKAGAIVGTASSGAAGPLFGGVLAPDPSC